MSMQVTSAASSTGATSSSSTATSTLPVQTLNQQDFLTLLVQQMTNQDPMNPQSNTDFAAQMAQFSALQQAQSTGTNISTLLGDQTMSQATSLLGKTVTLQADSTTTTQGVVNSVQIDSGTPKIVVNGTEYTLSQVLTVSPTGTQ